tara:strand:- start:470 stop:1117 length:648 start_codon:yes stop_codon:yes gene_type:complete
VNSLFLTTTELERLLKVFAWLIGLLWLLLFFVQWEIFDISASSAAFKAFSMAIAVSAVLFGLFYKVAWRWEWLAKWMNRPIVHGVWRGELRSDFDSKGSKPLVIPVFFIIKQTYLTLSVESFTESQEGESRLEAILRNTKTDASRLCYVFELRKLYPGANSLTSGTGDLKLLGNGRELSGTYWTDTPTHGELNLQLVTRDIKNIASFKDAVATKS